MKKFNVGDKVRISKKALEWFTSEEGHACYDPPGREMTHKEKQDMFKENCVVLTLLMDNRYPATVIEHSHAGTDAENYKVSVLGCEFRFETEHLSRTKYV